MLRLFSTSLWGACAGVLLATVVTAAMIRVNGDTQDRTHPALLRSEYLSPYEVVPWQERYERSWYVLVCVLGALGAWAAGFAKPSPWLAALAAVAFVPAATEACRGVFFGKPVTGRLLTCVGILAVPLLWRGGCAGVRESESAGDAKSSLAHPRPLTPWHLIVAVPLVAVLYGVFAPADLAATAGECLTELHVASYLVGPAQYYRAPGVVPGLDFESHYGIGHAYAFSWVMGGGGLQPVMERFVLFVLFVTLAYFLSAYLVLADWFRSPWAALGVTLVLALAATEGLAYPMPSCLPVRHPFAFAFLLCAARGTDSSKWCAAAGAVAGLSLFWQTDIGLFTLAAGAALYLANAVFLGGPWRQPLLFLAVGVGSFSALCLVLFGPRVLSVTFAERLLEPLLLYAGGFGTVLMNWRGGWGWWFNLAGPGVAIASVGVLIGYGRRTPPREVVYAAAASLLGLAMLTKWMNRSLDILWALNGGLVLAVAGFWCWVAWRTVAARLADVERPRVTFARRAVALAAAGALLMAAVCAEVQHARPHPLLGTTSPLVRIGNRLATFPNPINAARRPLKYTEPPVAFDEESVAFLREHTQESERVAVVSRLEWGALTAAGRAPRFSWVPLFLVHSPVLLDRCADDLRNTDRVFVEAGSLKALEEMHPSAHARLAPVIEGQFEPAERSPRWTIYVRRRGSLVSPRGDGAVDARGAVDDDGETSRSVAH